jgi:hypothetical protein
MLSRQIHPLSPLRKIQEVTATLSNKLLDSGMRLEDTWKVKKMVLLRTVSCAYFARQCI